jgi:hypothetical protein
MSHREQGVPPFNFFRIGATHSLHTTSAICVNNNCARL